MTSCNNFSGNHYPRYDTFPVESSISAEVIHLDSAIFRYPYRVAVKDSVAIVMDLHNADYYYHAFTYPEWGFITSFGKRGEAPEEMLSAEKFQFNSLDSIWALDAIKMLLTRWSISTTEQSALLKEKIKLDTKLVRSLDFYAMDSCFLVPDYLGEHRYSRVNYRGELIDSNGSIPSERANAHTSRPALAMAWRSFIDYNPNNQTLAMATQLGETLEIYNLREQTSLALYGPNGEPEFQAVEAIGVPTGIKGFKDIKITDSYIYAAFQGDKFKDITQARLDGKIVEEGGRYIYVFDLKGNPVKKYTLDRGISGFHINETENRLIALDLNNDQPIVEYILN